MLSFRISFPILAILFCALPIIKADYPTSLEDACDNCVELVGVIENEIINNGPMIEHALNATFCHSRACSLFIMEYFPIFIKVLTDQLTPNVTCNYLGWCNRSLCLRDLQDQCSTCIDIIGTVEYQIMTHASTIEAILNLIVCNSQNCSNALDKYFPIFIKMLNSQLAAPVVCSDLGWCNGKH